MATIGFIGLGNMGGPMATNLVKAGHSVTGYDLNLGALELLAKAGGKTAGSAAEAVTGAEVVITMLPAGQHVRDVYQHQGGVIDVVKDARPLLIDCSTIDVETARAVTAAAEQAGLAMLDAPVSGGTAGAQNATLTFMVGGTDDAFARGKDFYYVSVLMLAVCLVVGVLATAAAANREGDGAGWKAALMVALSPGLILAAYINWDLFAMALTACGLAAWAARRPWLAGALLGLAVATKFYPLLFFGALFLLCLRAGRIIEVDERPTISESTAGNLEPESVTLDICRAAIDREALVSEDEILGAMRRIVRTEHWLIEGAAALAVAAFLREQKRYEGRNVVIVLCGRNLSPEALGRLQ